MGPIQFNACTNSCKIIEFKNCDFYKIPSGY